MQNDPEETLRPVDAFVMGGEGLSSTDDDEDDDVVNDLDEDDD